MIYIDVAVIIFITIITMTIQSSQYQHTYKSLTTSKFIFPIITVIFSVTLFLYRDTSVSLFTCELMGPTVQVVHICKYENKYLHTLDRVGDQLLWNDCPLCIFFIINLFLTICSNLKTGVTIGTLLTELYIVKLKVGIILYSCQALRVGQCI